MTDYTEKAFALTVPELMIQSHRARAMRIAAALREAHEAGRREQAQWRPIESAPRDGTVIDVWLGDAEPADIDFYCTPGTRRSCGWSWRDDKFRPLGGLSVTVPTFVQPTHWLPLPQPPAEAEVNHG